MNILGVGGPELLIILVIMLVIAGPKRMIAWAYVLGQYVAKFRRMWAETVDVLQHEFDEAGVDIQIPRDMPTRGSLNKQATKMLGSVTDPVKETLQQVDSEVKEITKATSATTQSATSAVRGTNGHSTPRRTPTTPSRSEPPAHRPSTNNTSNGYGSWSSHNSKPDFGTWTANGEQQDDEE